MIFCFSHLSFQTPVYHWPSCQSGSLWIIGAFVLLIYFVLDRWKNWKDRHYLAWTWPLISVQYIMLNICISKLECLMDCVFIRAGSCRWSRLSCTSGSPGWWEVQSCVSVAFPGKDKACLICLARTNLCPGKVLNIFLYGATSFLLLSDWQGFPQAVCLAESGRAECVEIVCTFRLGTFVGLVPFCNFCKSSDKAGRKQAACQALHMGIINVPINGLQISMSFYTVQLIQCW